MIQQSRNPAPEIRAIINRMNDLLRHGTTVMDRSDICSKAITNTITDLLDSLERAEIADHQN